MTLILGCIAAGAIALRALWYRTIGNTPVVALSVGRQIKLGTNIMITLATAVGYIAELLSGTRTTLPGVSSTTAAVDTTQAGINIPSAAAFAARKAGALSDD